MPLSSSERRRLAAAGNRLKPAATISAGELDEGVVDHVRRLFAGRELVELRVQSDAREECEAVAGSLSARVPCELVARVGRVLLLYRPEEGAGAGAPLA